MTTQPKSASLSDRKILKHATINSFWKLNPKSMVKNPVMFVVEVGAVITLVVLISNLFRHAGGFGFGLQITLWLWFTVLLVSVILIVGALTFFPSLSLGPILEHLLMNAGKAF